MKWQHVTHDIKEFSTKLAHQADKISTNENEAITKNFSPQNTIFLSFRILHLALKIQDRLKYMGERRQVSY
jgi:hypothetical protein